MPELMRADLQPCGPILREHRSTHMVHTYGIKDASVPDCLHRETIVQQRPPLAVLKPAAERYIKPLLPTLRDLLWQDIGQGLLQDHLCTCPLQLELRRNRRGEFDELVIEERTA